MNKTNKAFKLGGVGGIKPRPSIVNYGAEPTGLKGKINRIEIYRTKRKRFELWKPKYTIHTLALTASGVYEIFPPDHKPHPPLFGENYDLPLKERRKAR